MDCKVVALMTFLWFWFFRLEIHRGGVVNKHLTVIVTQTGQKIFYRFCCLHLPRCQFLSCQEDLCALLTG